MKNKKTRFYQSIHFKIALVFFLILVVAVEIIGAYFVNQLENSTIQTFKNQITERVNFFDATKATEVLKDDSSESESNIRKVLVDFAGDDIVEVKLVDNKGYVRGTNEYSNQGIVNQKTLDPDIKKQLYANNNTPTSYEMVDPDNHKRYWVFIQTIQGGDDSPTSVGVLYVKTKMEPLYDRIKSINLIFLKASLLAGIVTLMIGIVIARAITRPIEEMKRQANKMSHGDYSGQVRVYGNDELGELAVGINDFSLKIQEAQATTDAERRRLDSVLSHMTDGVVATDRRGNVMIINDKAVELLDMDADDAIGQSILKVLNIENDYTLRSLLEMDTELVLNLTQGGNDALILRAEFSLIQRETGFISGLVCVLHDITEQEKNEQERREFVSNVSHELRTPLTSMRSYLEALEEGAWQDPEIAPEFLKVTREETDRMIRLITDLLNLSRMDSDNMHLELEFVNLNKLFAYVLDRFDMIVKDGENNHVIKREITKRDLWVELDADKFIQVLDNLMNNALKYSPNGGTITCRLMETERRVVLSISDEGIGIPKKDVAKVFDRFYRVDKARSRAMGGTGLGLAISKEVVEVLGGKIWLESVEGKGTTFYISLPYEPYEEDLWV